MVSANAESATRQNFLCSLFSVYYEKNYNPITSRKQNICFLFSTQYTVHRHVRTLFTVFHIFKQWNVEYAKLHHTIIHFRSSSSCFIYLFICSVILNFLFHKQRQLEKKNESSRYWPFAKISFCIILYVNASIDATSDEYRKQTMKKYI